MSEKVFVAEKLVKRYKRVNVLNKLNMEINRGSIYGFVGRNGAGKTTLMRILTGRAKQTAGKIEIFGEKTPAKLHIQRKNIGAVVESPAFYSNMTAKDNLEVVRLQCGIKDKGCIKELLKMAGLEDTGLKKAGNFSLGMKQRLSIAMALMGRPQLLVLDEPVNGLDPEGILQLRKLLEKINKEQEITILISSHILSELDQLATHYGFLHKGRLLKQISAAQLKEECKRHIKLKTDNVEKAVIILEEKLKIRKFSVYPDNSVRIFEKLEEVQAVSKILSGNGIIIEEISVQGENLETYFERLVGGIKNV